MATAVPQRQPVSPWWSNFLTWLAALITVLQFAWALYEFASTRWNALHKIGDVPTMARWVLLVQIITIVVLLLARAHLPLMRESKKWHDAIAASRQFRAYWSFIWVAWLCLYATWWFFWPAIVAGNEPPLVELLADLFGLIAEALIFMCYLVMVVRSVPPEHNRWATYTSIVMVSVILIAILDYAAVQVAPASAGLLHGFQSVLGGVAVALFVGRLDSKLIDVNRWVIAVLYAYAVLQLAGVALQADGKDVAMSFLILTSLALVFKVVLFMSGRSIIESGVLTYYMYEYRRAPSNESREHFLAQLLLPAETPQLP